MRMAVFSLEAVARAVCSGDALVDMLSYVEFTELLGRLALRFTPPKATLASTAGQPASPVRSVQQLLVEMDGSGGRETVRAKVRGSTGIPPFRGIQKMKAAK